VDKLIPIHPPEAHRVRVEETPARLGNGGEERFDRLDLGELAADFEQGL
jgi:hypothetical protein